MAEVTVLWDFTTKILRIMNLYDVAIAFQLQTYDDPKRFTFLPSKGVIMAKKQADVEIKVLKKGSEQNNLAFHLVAMAWCSSNNTFDSSLWKQMEAKKEGNMVVHFGEVPKYTGIMDPPPPIVSHRTLLCTTRSNHPNASFPRARAKKSVSRLKSLRTS